MWSEGKTVAAATRRLNLNVRVCARARARVLVDPPVRDGRSRSDLPKRKVGREARAEATTPRRVLFLCLSASSGGMLVPIDPPEGGEARAWGAIELQGTIEPRAAASLGGLEVGSLLNTGEVGLWRPRGAEREMRDDRRNIAPPSPPPPLPPRLGRGRGRLNCLARAQRGGARAG